MNSILSGRLMSTRGGTMAVGIGAAGLAAIVLLVYLNSYRNNVSASAQPLSVLVAKKLIPKGTSGTVIGTQQLFQVTSVARDQVKTGAVTDPSTIVGKNALADIYPGQQLTVADFSAVPSTAIPTRITGDERALAVPVDVAGGLIGHLQAGDHVDVYVGLNAQAGGVTRPVLRLLLSNIMVLAAPAPEAGSQGGGGGSIVLRAKGVEAARIAFASDHGKLWFVLRPQSGAKPTRPSITTVESLLVGTRPVPAEGG